MGITYSSTHRQISNRGKFGEAPIPEKRESYKYLKNEKERRGNPNEIYNDRMRTKKKKNNSTRSHQSEPIKRGYHKIVIPFRGASTIGIRTMGHTINRTNWRYAHRIWLFICDSSCRQVRLMSFKWKHSSVSLKIVARASWIIELFVDIY